MSKRSPRPETGEDARVQSLAPRHRLDTAVPRRFPPVAVRFHPTLPTRSSRNQDRFAAKRRKRRKRGKPAVLRGCCRHKVCQESQVWSRGVPCYTRLAPDRMCTVPPVGRDCTHTGRRVTRGYDRAVRRPGGADASPPPQQTPLTTPPSEYTLPVLHKYNSVTQ